MANRNTLHMKHLEAFTAYLTTQGYERKPTTNDYEVLRMRKGKDTVILYRQNNMEQHYSVRDKDMWLVYNFFGAARKSEKEICKDECAAGGGYEAWRPKRQPCPFCHADNDGDYSMFQFANPNNPQQVAMLSFYGGRIAFNLTTPGEEKEQHISAQIQYCPMCGRRFEVEDEN